MFSSERWQMAFATISVALEDDLVEQIDLIADTASVTRAELIGSFTRMYLSDRRRLRELYASGESAAAKNSLTEEDMFEAIRDYRQAT
ncbi:MAG: hypothetical protein FWE09_06480 [Treponema sp.]|nr:hypothetical protein [Treponema sp.]